MARQRNGDGQSARERERRDAEAKLADARARLEEAQQAAAEAGSGLAAVTTRNIPEMEVEVLPGNTVSHNGVTYYGEGYSIAPDEHAGSRLTVDGPTALALMQAGHVRIAGAA